MSLFQFWKVCVLSERLVPWTLFLKVLLYMKLLTWLTYNWCITTRRLTSSEVQPATKPHPGHHSWVRGLAIDPWPVDRTSFLKTRKDNGNPGICRELLEVKVKPCSRTHEAGTGNKSGIKKGGGGELLSTNSKYHSRSNTDGRGSGERWGWMIYMIKTEESCISTSIMETPMIGVFTAWYRERTKGPVESLHEENVLRHLVSKDFFPDSILLNTYELSHF